MLHRGVAGLVAVGWFAVGGVSLGLTSGCADDGATGGGSAADGGGGQGPGPSGSGGHGCFETETLCAGACVDVSSHSDHCGQCDNPCANGDNQEGQCVEGTCVNTCATGFVADQGSCKNFFGAHEAFPGECPGCSQANAYSAECSCPAFATELPLLVQSDCPTVPMRFATSFNLCVTSGVSPGSDFGGAYQLDDFDGLCGAGPASCRAGNPLAGGECACPEGFDDTSTVRSIIRLPCDGSEVGSRIVFCGNKEAPPSSFGGVYQVDDIEPSCRVVNPWTGACSCPEGTTDTAYRVMVDGAQGLYGSRLHMCTL